MSEKDAKKYWTNYINDNGDDCKKFFAENGEGLNQYLTFVNSRQNKIKKAV